MMEGKRNKAIRRRSIILEKKWVAAVGKPGRLLVARLLPGQDVVEVVIELVKANGIKS